MTIEGPAAPTLAIITVCLDDIDALKATARALRAQAGWRDLLAGGAITWLVQHGGQMAGIAGLVPEADVESRPDAGVYDAMNRAMARTRARYLWFLNAGDRPADADVLGLILAILGGNPAPDLLLGGAVVEDASGRRWQRRSRPVRPGRPRGLLPGMPTSHQAIIYASTALPPAGYALGWPLAADYAATVLAVRNARRVEIIDRAICISAPPGLSGRFAARARAEQGAIRRSLMGVDPISDALIRAAQALVWAVRVHAPGLYRRLRGAPPG